MVNGAITIIALFVLLFSCAAQVTAQSLPAPLFQPAPPDVLPDLIISDLSLSDAGKVEVVISNKGGAAASYGVGSLEIYVDGILKWKDSLGTLPDQTFLVPGGVVLYTTPVELVGRREVQAVLDNEGRMVEENDRNNVFKRALGEEKIKVSPLLPDLTITDLFLIPRRRLAVTIANLGESPLPLRQGNLKIMVDGSTQKSYPLETLSEQSVLPTKGTTTLTTPFTLVGRHEIDIRIDLPEEVRESNEENNRLKKIVVGPPVGPDILVKDLDLTEDLELIIVLCNAGEVDLRKGVIFQIQVFVNDQKISEFDHFISEVLKADFGSRYIVSPPYEVDITGTSKVKVSISPELSTHDICLENNVLERTFIIFPFKIEPRKEEGFSFSFFLPRHQSESKLEKVKVEARWEVGSSSLTLFFKKSGILIGIPPFSGRSPLKVEFTIPFEEAQKESFWSISVTNPTPKRVEGYLIIQHP